MSATDAEILAGDSVTVTLCGAEFVYPEPVRRQARAMLAGLIPLQAEAASADPAVKIAAITKMLDWLAMWCEPLRKRRDILDSADEIEIAVAFNAVAGLVTRPFVALAEKMIAARAEQAAAQSPDLTTSQEPMSASCANGESPSTT